MNASGNGKMKTHEGGATLCVGAWDGIWDLDLDLGLVV